MTKEIIIDGVNVAECDRHCSDNHNIPNRCYSDINESYRDCKPKEYQCNFYVERLEQENEELKKYIKDLQVRKDRYYLQVLEFERQISDWVTFYMKISNIVLGNYEILDSQGLQDLRRIVNEVLNEQNKGETY